MNLSFSTRGWQSLGWDEIIEIADEMRFSGIELYNVHKRFDLMEKGAPLHKYSTSATARSLREKGIKIPCLDTSLDISLEANFNDSMIKGTIDTAHNLKVPYVCVVALNDNEEIIRTRLADLIDYAQKETIVRFVVGYPVNMNGAPSEAARDVDVFLKHLAKAFPDVPVVKEDERFTSVLAHRAMIDGGMKKHDRQKKESVDKISAAIILQSYMDRSR